MRDIDYLANDPDVDQVIGYPDKTMVVLDAESYLRLKGQLAELKAAAQQGSHAGRCGSRPAERLNMNELEVLKKKYKDTAIIDIPSLHRVIIVPGVSFPQDYVAAAAELAALTARVAELEAALESIAAFQPDSNGYVRRGVLDIAAAALKVVE